MADPRIPTPDQPVDEIIILLGQLSDAEAARWVQDNRGSLSKDALEALLVATKYRKASSWQEPVEVKETIAALEVALDVESMPSAAETARNEAETAREAAEDAAREAGGTPGLVEAAGEAASREVFEGLVPDIILQYTNRGLLSNDARNELVKTWNEFNPLEPVTNIRELYARINAAPADPMTGMIVDAAFNGADPVTTYQFTFGARDQYDTGNRFGGVRRDPLPEGVLGQTTVTIDAAQFEQLKAMYGDEFDRRDLRSMALLANRLGVTDQSGQVAWQMVAALAAGIGWFDIDADLAIDGAPRRPTSPTSATPGDTLPATKEQRMAAGRQRAMYNTLQSKVVLLKNGLAMYDGNDTLALIHAMNPGLASRMATSNALSNADADLAGEILLKAGFNTDALANMGYYASDLAAYQAAKNAAEAAGGGGGGGAVRTAPDPDAIRQSVKDLYRVLYAADPDEATLAKVSSAVTSAIMSSDVDGSDGVLTSVSGEAQIRKQLEALPEYKDLYGNKPGGMTEGEYQNQFNQAARSMLGAEAADPNAVRSGMRTGIYQTTVGAAATSKKAFDNSTFMGRLAAAAQVVSSNT